MSNTISKFIQLSHENIIYNSEIIILRQKGYVLKRGIDYIIDYEKGKIYFLMNSYLISRYKRDVEKYGLDIKYTYYLNINKEKIFHTNNIIYNEEPQISIFDNKLTLEKEVDTIIEIRDIDKNIKYEPLNIYKNTVEINLKDLSTKDLETKCFFKRYDFDDFLNFILLYNIDNGYKNLNSITSYQIENKYTYIFDSDEIITLYTPLYCDINIKLFNGKELTQDDYIINTDIINNFYDFNKHIITINNRYSKNKILIKLSYNPDIKIKSNNMLVKISPINEFLDLTINNKLNYLQSLYEINTDNTITNFIKKNINIIIYDHLNKNIYKEFDDYHIDYDNAEIIRLNPQMSDKVVAIYQEEIDIKNLIINTITNRIYVDYIYKHNYIDWSEYKIIKKFQKEIDVYIGTQLIQLEEYPINWKEIKIYLSNDLYKRNIVDIYKYDEVKNTIFIKTNTYGKAIIEYDYVSYPIKVGEKYYITYKYGASYERIKNYFLKIMNLINLRKTIQEKTILKKGDNKYYLKNYPIDNNIKIYKNENKMERVSIIDIDYDNNIVYFDSIDSDAEYIIEYQVNGFDRKMLLNVLNRLYSENDRNVSIKNIKNIISTVVDDYEIITTKDIISQKVGDIITSNLDYNFKYVKSGLDGNGALFLDNNYIKLSSKYISPIEGTIEFMFSGKLDDNLNKKMYFVDIYNKINKNEFKNRISLYRDDKYIYLDLYNNNGKLIRKIQDIRGKFYTERVYLAKNTKEIKLSKLIDRSIRDYDNNETPDYYDGINGKIIIMPDISILNYKYKNTIKIKSVDFIENKIIIENILYDGFYYITYPINIHDNFEALNFLAFTWKLHSNDLVEPFINLYYNGIKTINETISNILDINNIAYYDIALYDKDKYSR